MNILFICDEYPPGKNGGIGTSVQNISRELIKQGHKAYVVGLYTYAYGGADFELDEGVFVWRFRYGLKVGLPDEHFVNKTINQLPRFIKKYLNGVQAYNRFIRFIQHTVFEQKIDVIEIGDWNTFAMNIGFGVKWPDFTVPFVVKVHGSYTYFQNEMGKSLKKRYTRIDSTLYQRADAISAVSRYAAMRTASLFEIKMPIRVLYNGLKLEKHFKEREIGGIKVIFTGSLYEKKGIYQLAKAWNIVIQRIPEAKLFIYGKGNKQAVVKLLEPVSVKTVIFKGHVEKSELYQALATATLAVFPSYSETFGLAPVEAMAQGCPVIFTTRSSGPEIIEDKKEGELIDPDNVDEIADRICHIVSHPDLQRKYTINGRNKVEQKFNVVTSVSEHIEFYSSVIKDRQLSEIAKLNRVND